MIVALYDYHPAVCLYVTSCVTSFRCIFEITEDFRHMWTTPTSSVFVS